MTPLTETLDQSIYNLIQNYVLFSIEDGMSEKDAKTIMEAAEKLKSTKQFSIAFAQALVDTKNVVIRKDQL